jgi:inactivated superfamily I helicase
MRQAIIAWKSRAEQLQSTLHEREALAAAQQQQIITLQEQMAQLQLALQDQQEQTDTLSQTLSDSKL